MGPEGGVMRHTAHGRWRLCSTLICHFNLISYPSLHTSPSTFTPPHTSPLLTPHLSPPSHHTSPLSHTTSPLSLTPHLPSPLPHLSPLSPHTSPLPHPTPPFTLTPHLPSPSPHTSLHPLNHTFICHPSSCSYWKSCERGSMTSMPERSRRRGGGTAHSSTTTI